MDLEVQGRIKEIAEKYGPENVVVILGSDYYIVYGIEKAPKTKYTNKKILYIYNFRTKEFVDLVVDFQLTDILFIN